MALPTDPAVLDELEGLVVGLCYNVIDDPEDTPSNIPGNEDPTLAEWRDQYARDLVSSPGQKARVYLEQADAIELADNGAYHDWESMNHNQRQNAIEGAFDKIAKARFSPPFEVSP